MSAKLMIISPVALENLIILLTMSSITINNQSLSKLNKIAYVETYVDHLKSLSSVFCHT